MVQGRNRSDTCERWMFAESDELALAGPPDGCCTRPGVALPSGLSSQSFSGPARCGSSLPRVRGGAPANSARGGTLDCAQRLPYAALLPWTFFANAVTNSGNSLVGSTNLITKVYFPRVIIPAAAVAAGLVDFCIAFILLIVMMFYYQIGVHAGMLLLPVFIFLAIMLALGVGMLMSALNVKYRDVRHALPFLIQIGMFASPVMYPVPDSWRGLFALNPMTGIIHGFRSALFGKPFDWFTLGTSALIILLILITSVFTFNRMEKSFADVI